MTPCYNHAQFIEQTLQSVLNQGYPNLEYIVIDGGSKDGSQEIIERYAHQLTYYLIEPNTRQIDKLIKGFNLATGDILCMLNSDDLFEPWTLQEVALFFISNPKSRVVYGDYSWIDEQGDLIKRKKELPFNRFIYMYYVVYIPQPSTFWRRDLYEEVGGLNPQFDLAMDADLWIRFADITKIYHVHKFWSKYRKHSQQKSSIKKIKMYAETEKIWQRYRDNEPKLFLLLKKIIATLMWFIFRFIMACF